MKVANWNEAEQAVKDLANGLPIYYGSGNPIAKPHVLACTKDAWSGEGMGYNVTIWPEGDNGLSGMNLGLPYTSHSIEIG